MTLNHQTISGYSIGDDFDITRTVTSIPASTTITKAWFGVKEFSDDTDANAKILKEITVTSVNGTGQVTDTGADGTGAVLFQIRTANTVGNIVPRKRYAYAIKVLLSSGLKDTIESGVFILRPRVIEDAA